LIASFYNNKLSVESTVTRRKSAESSIHQQEEKK